MKLFKFLVYSCFVFVLVSISGMSFAEQPQHGLSLFGNLKYSHNFTHFDYVNPQAPKGGKVRYATVGSFDSLNPFILKQIIVSIL